MPLQTARQLHVNRQPSCTRQCLCVGTEAPRPPGLPVCRSPGSALLLPAIQQLEPVDSRS